MPKAEKEFKQANCTCIYSCNNRLQFSTFSPPVRSLLEISSEYGTCPWGYRHNRRLFTGAHDYESIESLLALMYISMACMRVWKCFEKLVFCLSTFLSFVAFFVSILFIIICIHFNLLDLYGHNGIQKSETTL